MKHLVVTVINKKKERTKLWTRTRISEQAHNNHKNKLKWSSGQRVNLKFISFQDIQEHSRLQL